MISSSCTELIHVLRAMDLAFSVNSTSATEELKSQGKKLQVCMLLYHNINTRYKSVAFFETRTADFL